MKKRIALILVLALTLLAGCAAEGRSDSADRYMENGSDMELKEELFFYGAASPTLAAASVEADMEQVQTDDQKLIRTVYASVETRDLDTLLETVSDQVSQQGGYIQSRDIYNGSAYSARRSRSANMTVRIPAEKLDLFMGRIQEVSNVISYNETLDDVTTAYVDTESRMKALETEQARLLELLEKAESMADLLEIESRLTEVRYELESVGSQLRVYDNKINYATLHLSISQVEELTETEELSFWQKVQNGFLDSLENLGAFLLGLAGALMTGSPYLIFLALMAVAVVFLWKAARRAKKKKTANQPPQSPEKPE